MPSSIPLPCVRPAPRCWQCNPCREHARYLARKAYPEVEPCEVCGHPRGERCHFDYAEPLRIRWLCAVHHVRWDWGRKWAAQAEALRAAGHRPLRVCLVILRDEAA